MDQVSTSRKREGTGTVSIEEEGTDDVLASQCKNALHLWCPSVFSSRVSLVPCFAGRSDPFSQVSESEEKRLGRILVFRHCKILVVMLIENWGEFEDEVCYA